MHNYVLCLDVIINNMEKTCHGITSRQLNRAKQIIHEWMISRLTQGHHQHHSLELTTNSSQSMNNKLVNHKACLMNVLQLKLVP